MLYESTRGQYQRKVSSAEAIKMGIAPDGGLFVPVKIPFFNGEKMREMTALDYRDKAVCILKAFLSDFTEEEIRECVAQAYSPEKFDAPEVAPVRKPDDALHFLELWHGPTCAFKDMALQLLPHLLTKAAVKTGEKASIVILVATSGDTGKAALEGFKDVPGTKIIVFYPARGVSEVQKYQMITQEGANVAVVAVRGNFDDAQTGVKNIFSNAEFNRLLQKKHCRLSSANSINWGRLAPQIVYYFSAYLDLAAKGALAPGEKINFVVPTGNFGNILAAFYAREMGLPVNRLICAANVNNVLTGFIRTGVYDRVREFHRTISPSMDILISSNLERLLYHLSGRDHARIREWMTALNQSGVYRVDAGTRARIGEIFWSGYADDDETLTTINSLNRRCGYVVDTHTAVGVRVYEKYTAATGDGAKTVIVSTASPFKFNESVARAVLGEDAVKGKNEFRLLEKLAAATGLEIPAGLKDLDKKPARHRKTVDRNQITAAVEDILLRSI